MISLMMFVRSGIKVSAEAGLSLMPRDVAVQVWKVDAIAGEIFRAARLPVRASIRYRPQGSDFAVGFEQAE